MSKTISAIGQDSHRFEPDGSVKPLVLGGVIIPGCPGLKGNSDADVILHAITNAVSGASGVNILGARSDELCLKQGITDSRAYLKEALDALNGQPVHVSVSVEGARPKLATHIPAIKASIARLCGLEPENVGLTATTGEDLSAFGRGEGVFATVIVTVSKH